MGQTTLMLANGNADQRMFLVGLQSLRRAHAHQASKLFDKVMFNIEVLAFSIWWTRVVGNVSGSFCKALLTHLMQGFPDFPRDQSDLLVQLQEYVPPRSATTGLIRLSQPMPHPRHVS